MLFSNKFVRTNTNTSMHSIERRRIMTIGFHSSVDFPALWNATSDQLQRCGAFLTALQTSLAATRASVDSSWTEQNEALLQLLECVQQHHDLLAVTTSVAVFIDSCPDAVPEPEEPGVGDTGAKGAPPGNVLPLTLDDVVDPAAAWEYQNQYQSNNSMSSATSSLLMQNNSLTPASGVGGMGGKAIHALVSKPSPSSAAAAAGGAPPANKTLPAWQRKLPLHPFAFPYTEFCSTVWLALDPRYPIGVQRRALEILEFYASRIIGADRWKLARENMLQQRDFGFEEEEDDLTFERGIVNEAFPMLLIGVLQLIPQCSMQIKMTLLDYAESVLLFLSPAAVRQAAEGLLAAVLPLLEEAEGSELHRRGLRLLACVHRKLASGVEGQEEGVAVAYAVLWRMLIDTPHLSGGVWVALLFLTQQDHTKRIVEEQEERRSAHKTREALGQHPLSSMPGANPSQDSTYQPPPNVSAPRMMTADVDGGGDTKSSSLWILHHRYLCGGDPKLVYWGVFYTFLSSYTNGAAGGAGWRTAAHEARTLKLALDFLLCYAPVHSFLLRKPCQLAVAKTEQTIKGKTNPSTFASEEDMLPALNFSMDDVALLVAGAVQLMASPRMLPNVVRRLLLWINTAAVEKETMSYYAMVKTAGAVPSPRTASSFPSSCGGGVEESCGAGGAVPPISVAFATAMGIPEAEAKALLDVASSPHGMDAKGSTGSGEKAWQTLTVALTQSEHAGALLISRAFCLMAHWWISKSYDSPEECDHPPRSHHQESRQGHPCPRAANPEELDTMAKAAEERKPLDNREIHSVLPFVCTPPPRYQVSMETSSSCSFLASRSAVPPQALAWELLYEDSIQSLQELVAVSHKNAAGAASSPAGAVAASLPPLPSNASGVGLKNGGIHRGGAAAAGRAPRSFLPSHASQSTSHRSPSLSGTAGAGRLKSHGVANRKRTQRERVIAASRRLPASVYGGGGVQGAPSVSSDSPTRTRGRANKRIGTYPGEGDRGITGGGVLDSQVSLPCVWYTALSAMVGPAPSPASSSALAYLVLPTGGPSMMMMATDDLETSNVDPTSGDGLPSSAGGGGGPSASPTPGGISHLSPYSPRPPSSTAEVLPSSTLGPVGDPLSTFLRQNWGALLGPALCALVTVMGEMGLSNALADSVASANSNGAGNENESSTGSPLANTTTALATVEGWCVAGQATLLSRLGLQWLVDLQRALCAVLTVPDGVANENDSIPADKGGLKTAMVEASVSSSQTETLAEDVLTVWSHAHALWCTVYLPEVQKTLLQYGLGHGALPIVGASAKLFQVDNAAGRLPGQVRNDVLYWSALDASLIAFYQEHHRLRCQLRSGCSPPPPLRDGQSMSFSAGPRSAVGGGGGPTMAGESVSSVQTPGNSTARAAAAAGAGVVSPPEVGSVTGILPRDPCALSEPPSVGDTRSSAIVSPEALMTDHSQARAAAGKETLRRPVWTLAMRKGQQKLREVLLRLLEAALRQGLHLLRVLQSTLRDQSTRLHSLYAGGTFDDLMGLPAEALSKNGEPTAVAAAQEDMFALSSALIDQINAHLNDILHPLSSAVVAVVTLSGERPSLVRSHAKQPEIEGGAENGFLLSVAGASSPRSPTSRSVAPEASTGVPLYQFPKPSLAPASSTPSLTTTPPPAPSRLAGMTGDPRDPVGRKTTIAVSDIQELLLVLLEEVEALWGRMIFPALQENCDDAQQWRENIKFFSSRCSSPSLSSPVDGNFVRAVNEAEHRNDLCSSSKPFEVLLLHRPLLHQLARGWARWVAFMTELDVSQLLRKPTTAELYSGGMKNKEECTEVDYSNAEEPQMTSMPSSLSCSPTAYFSFRCLNDVLALVARNRTPTSSPHFVPYSSENVMVSGLPNHSVVLSVELLYSLGIGLDAIVVEAGVADKNQGDPAGLSNKSRSPWWQWISRCVGPLLWFRIVNMTTHNARTATDTGAFMSSSGAWCWEQSEDTSYRDPLEKTLAYNGHRQSGSARGAGRTAVQDTITTKKKESNSSHTTSEWNTEADREDANDDTKDEDSGRGALKLGNSPAVSKDTGSRRCSPIRDSISLERNNDLEGTPLSHALVLATPEHSYANRFTWHPGEEELMIEKFIGLLVRGAHYSESGQEMLDSLVSVSSNGSMSNTQTQIGALFRLTLYAIERAQEPLRSMSDVMDSKVELNSKEMMATQHDASGMSVMKPAEVVESADQTQGCQYDSSYRANCVARPLAFSGMRVAQLCFAAYKHVLHVLLNHSSLFSVSSSSHLLSLYSTPHATTFLHFFFHKPQQCLFPLYGAIAAYTHSHARMFNAVVPGALALPPACHHMDPMIEASSETINMKEKTAAEEVSECQQSFHLAEPLPDRTANDEDMYLVHPLLLRWDEWLRHTGVKGKTAGQQQFKSEWDIRAGTDETKFPSFCDAVPLKKDEQDGKWETSATTTGKASVSGAQQLSSLMQYLSLMLRRLAADGGSKCTLHRSLSTQESPATVCAMKEENADDEDSETNIWYDRSHRNDINGSICWCQEELHLPWRMTAHGQLLPNVSTESEDRRRSFFIPWSELILAVLGTVLDNLARTGGIFISLSTTAPPHDVALSHTKVDKMENMDDKPPLPESAKSPMVTETCLSGAQALEQLHWSLECLNELSKARREHALAGRHGQLRSAKEPELVVDLISPAVDLLWRAAQSPVTELVFAKMAPPLFQWVLDSVGDENSVLMNSWMRGRLLTSNDGAFLQWAEPRPIIPVKAEPSSTSMANIPSSVESLSTFPKVFDYLVHVLHRVVGHSTMSLLFYCSQALAISPLSPDGPAGTNGSVLGGVTGGLCPTGTGTAAFPHNKDGPMMGSHSGGFTGEELPAVSSSSSPYAANGQEVAGQAPYVLYVCRLCTRKLVQFQVRQSSAGFTGVPLQKKVEEEEWQTVISVLLSMWRTAAEELWGQVIQGEVMEDGGAGEQSFSTGALRASAVNALIKAVKECMSAISDIIVLVVNHRDEIQKGEQWRRDQQRPQPATDNTSSSRSWWRSNTQAKNAQPLSTAGDANNINSGPNGIEGIHEPPSPLSVIEDQLSGLLKVLFAIGLSPPNLGKHWEDGEEEEYSSSAASMTSAPCMMHDIQHTARHLIGLLSHWRQRDEVLSCFVHWWMGNLSSFSSSSSAAAAPPNATPRSRHPSTRPSAREENPHLMAKVLLLTSFLPTEEDGGQGVGGVATYEDSGPLAQLMLELPESSRMRRHLHHLLHEALPAFRYYAQWEVTGFMQCAGYRFLDIIAMCKSYFVTPPPPPAPLARPVTAKEFGTSPQTGTADNGSLAAGYGSSASSAVPTPQFLSPCAPTAIGNGGVLFGPSLHRQGFSSRLFSSRSTMSFSQLILPALLSPPSIEGGGKTRGHRAFNLTVGRSSYGGTGRGSQAFAGPTGFSASFSSSSALKAEGAAVGVAAGAEPIPREDDKDKKRTEVLDSDYHAEASEALDEEDDDHTQEDMLSVSITYFLTTVVYGFSSAPVSELGSSIYLLVMLSSLRHRYALVKSYEENNRRPQNILPASRVNTVPCVGSVSHRRLSDEEVRALLDLSKEMLTRLDSNSATIFSSGSKGTGSTNAAGTSAMLLSAGVASEWTLRIVLEMLHLTLQLLPVQMESPSPSADGRAAAAPVSSTGRQRETAASYDSTAFPLAFTTATCRKSVEDHLPGMLHTVLMRLSRSQVFSARDFRPEAHCLNAISLHFPSLFVAVRFMALGEAGVGKAIPAPNVVTPPSTSSSVTVKAFRRVCDALCQFFAQSLLPALRYSSNQASTPSRQKGAAAHSSGVSASAAASKAKPSGASFFFSSTANAHGASSAGSGATSHHRGGPAAPVFSSVLATPFSYYVLTVARTLLLLPDEALQQRMNEQFLIRAFQPQFFDLSPLLLRQLSRLWYAASCVPGFRAAMEGRNPFPGPGAGSGSGGITSYIVGSDERQVAHGKAEFLKLFAFHTLSADDSGISGREVLNFVVSLVHLRLREYSAVNTLKSMVNSKGERVIETPEASRWNLLSNPAEHFKNVVVPAMVEVWCATALLFRCLVWRLEDRSLTFLWPVMLPEILHVLRLPSGPSIGGVEVQEAVQVLKLEAIKTIDMAMTLCPSSFAVFRWLFFQVKTWVPKMLRPIGSVLPYSVSSLLLPATTTPMHRNSLDGSSQEGRSTDSDSSEDQCDFTGSLCGDAERKRGPCTHIHGGSAGVELTQEAQEQDDDDESSRMVRMTQGGPHTYCGVLRRNLSATERGLLRREARDAEEETHEHRRRFLLQSAFTQLSHLPYRCPSFFLPAADRQRMEDWSGVLFATMLLVQHNCFPTLGRPMGLSPFSDCLAGENGSHEMHGVSSSDRKETSVGAPSRNRRHHRGVRKLSVYPSAWTWHLEEVQNCLLHDFTHKRGVTVNAGDNGK